MMNHTRLLFSVLLICISSNVLYGQDQNKVALDKFKKIVTALKNDSTITPRNKTVEDGLTYTHDTLGTSYDIVPTNSLVTGFIGNYKVKISITKETNGQQYTSESDYIFRFDRDSQMWEFSSRKRVLTHHSNSVLNKAGDQETTTVDGLKGFNPVYQKAILRAVNAQNK